MHKVFFSGDGQGHDDVQNSMELTDHGKQSMNR